jgi:hypothetical protein
MSSAGASPAVIGAVIAIDLVDEEITASTSKTLTQRRALRETARV